MKNPDDLSPREIETVSFVIKGFAYKNIADAMGISIDTVYTHMRNIHNKTSAHTIAELINWALHNGFDADGNYTAPPTQKRA